MTLTKRTFLAGLAAMATLPTTTLAQDDSILGELNFRLTFVFNAPDGTSSSVPVAPEDVVKAVDMGPKSGLPFLANIVGEDASAQMDGFPTEESQALELIVREGLIGVAHGRVAIRDLPFELGTSSWTGILSVTRPE